MQPRDIPPDRKALFCAGTVLTAVGGLLFLGAFLTAILLDGHGDTGKACFLTAFAGMILSAVGGVVRTIGARGLAGSGLILDPDRARKDLEPFSRMAGGMVKDGLDEARIDLHAEPQKVIMLQCPGCGKWNEQDSKFCQECGRRF